MFGWMRLIDDLFYILIWATYGTRKEMNNPTLLTWLKRMSLTTEHILSVCTGALLIAKAGLMED